MLTTLQCSLRDPLRRVARKVREAVEQHRGTSIVQHAPVYLRTAQLNDERRVDDEPLRAAEAEVRVGEGDAQLALACFSSSAAAQHEYEQHCGCYSGQQEPS